MYSKKPCNYDEIKELFLLDLETISKYLQTTQTIIFYDTCSLGNHARLNPVTQKYDILDVFTKDDLIVITDKILEEMINNTTNEISHQYIKYLEVLKQNVKDLILLCECELENLLSFKYGDKYEIRNIILDVIKEVFGQYAPREQKKLIHTIDIDNKEFLKLVFNAVDIARKNRGEISIMICLLVIERIRKKNFRILTDDKKALKYFMSPFDNKKALSNISVESSIQIIQYLLRNSISWKIKSMQDLCDILNVVRTDQSNKILYNNIIDGKIYRNTVEEQLNNSELAKKLLNNTIEIVF